MVKNKTKELPLINGQRVIIRLPDYKDVDAIISYYIKNKRHLVPFEPIRDESFYTKDFWEKDIQNRLKDFLEDRSLRMFIFDIESNSIVLGTVNFNNIVSGVFYACYLGYNLDEERQGKGYMLESLKFSIEYAFKGLYLHRIMANYMPHNIRSGKVLKRLGFTVEGYARDYLLINGKWEDHILTSLTNKDWNSNSSPT